MVASLAELGLKTSKRKVSVPISQPINEDSPKLVGKMIHLFLSGNGCVAWLSNTIRLDVAYAFSRIGQHSAAPNISALQALAQTVSYLEQHKHLCLSQKLYPEDLPVEYAAESDNFLVSTCLGRMISLLRSVMTHSWRQSMCLSLERLTVPLQKASAVALSIRSTNGFGNFMPHSS